MSSTSFNLELTTAETSLPIRNFWPLYLHDLASYESKPPNAHGVLADDPEVRSYDELMPVDSPWWNQPELLFPYLLRVDGVPAGFCLVATGGYVPVPDVDFIVYEMFVAHEDRGTGAAEFAGQEALSRHRGRWEIVTWPKAERAQAFWRKVLPGCATGEVVETFGDHPFGEKVIFRFDNRVA